MTYQVDALRTLMLRGAESSIGLTTDFLVLSGIALWLIVLAARLYPRMGT